MGFEDVLQGVLDGMSAQLVGSGTPEPGELVTAILTPSVDDLDITDVLSGDLDLTFITKDVLFSSEDPEADLGVGALAAAITDGQPFSSTATGTLVNLDGVPGMLGQIKGTIPLPMSSTVPVQLRVTWEVLDAEERPLGSGEYQTPTGLAAPTLRIAFRPEVTELTTAAPPAPIRRKLRANVTLTANGISVGPRPLPPIEVLVPALPVPTVLALFLHKNFQARSGDDDGALLLVVPANSPLKSLSQLQPVLNQLQAVLGNLSSFGSFAAFLLGLSDLVSAVNATKSANIQFRSTDRINNLNDITLIQRDWYENDTEAEDELSSLILVGPTGRRAQLANAHDLDQDEGRFTVTTGDEMLAIIRDLHHERPTCAPGSIDIDKEPPGGWFNPDTFGDELSSLRFP
jgi:hypothetical protein